MFVPVIPPRTHSSLEMKFPEEMEHEICSWVGSKDDLLSLMLASRSWSKTAVKFYYRTLSLKDDDMAEFDALDEKTQFIILTPSTTNLSHVLHLYLSFENFCQFDRFLQHMPHLSKFKSCRVDEGAWKLLGYCCPKLKFIDATIPFRDRGLLRFYSNTNPLIENFRIRSLGAALERRKKTPLPSKSLSLNSQH